MYKDSDKEIHSEDNLPSKLEQFLILWYVIYNYTGK